MTFQSSFLIRCWLVPGQPAVVRSYHVEHVQSGGEFRSGDFTEVSRWINETNIAYLTEAVARPEEDSL